MYTKKKYFAIKNKINILNPSLGNVEFADFGNLKIRTNIELKNTIEIYSINNLFLTFNVKS